MNLKALRDVVQAKVGGFTKKEVDAILATAFNELGQAIMDGKEISIRDFGKIYTTPIKSRVNKHPATGKEVVVPATRRVSFSPSGKIKEALKPKS